MSASAFLAYLRARLAEPGSHRALAVAFGLAGISVTDQASQTVLAALALLTTIAAVFLKERGAVPGATANPVSAAVIATLLDLMGQGPALADVAKQVYALHATGRLDGGEALDLLGKLNAVAAPLAAPAQTPLPGPAAPATGPTPAPAAPIAQGA